jgi:hypothetical protein
VQTGARIIVAGSKFRVAMVYFYLPAEGRVPHREGGGIENNKRQWRRAGVKNKQK